MLTVSFSPSSLPVACAQPAYGCEKSIEALSITWDEQGSANPEPVLTANCVAPARTHRVTGKAGFAFNRASSAANPSSAAAKSIRLDLYRIGASLVMIWRVLSSSVRSSRTSC